MILINHLKRFISKQILRIFSLAFTIALVICAPFLFILLCPIYIFRLLISHLAKLFRSDLGKILTTRSTLFSVMNVYKGKPELNLVTTSVLRGKVDFETFRNLVKDKFTETRLPNGDYKYPEFRQYIFNWMGFAFWKWDKNFEIANHFTLLTPEKFRPSEAKEMKQKLILTPYVSKRSPWEFILVQNYEDKECEHIDGPKTLVFFRTHHSLCDGYAMLKVMLQAAESTKTNEELKELLKSHKENKPKTKFITEIMKFIKLPYDFAYIFIDAFCIKPWGVAPWKYKKEAICLTSEKIDSEFIKNVKNGHNVSFTSVLLAALTAGVRKGLLMSKRKDDIPYFMYLALPFPVPMHPDKLRNHITLGLVQIPVGEPDSNKRLKICHRNFEAAKSSLFPFAFYLICPFAGGLFHWLIKPATNLFWAGVGLTSFPGPKTPLMFNGNETIDTSLVVSLPNGSLGVVFTILSYVGGLKFSVIVDKAIFEEDSQVQTIMDAVVEELDDLTAQLL